MTEKASKVPPVTEVNGVIRISRKGMRKFAFGDDGDPFEVDVVVAMQQWTAIVEQFYNEDDEIPTERMPEYHSAARRFVEDCVVTSSLPSGGAGTIVIIINTSEALDFIARLRECYDEVVAFFRPRSREERASPDSTGAGLQFSEEPPPPPPN